MSLSVLQEQGVPCQKCGNGAVINNRKENICDECFNRFIRGKLRKSLRSDIYKTNSRHGTHKVMIAFKGNNSLSCLDMAQELLMDQVHNSGKSGFQLVVVHIDEGEDTILSQLKEFYKDGNVDIQYKTVQADEFLKGKDLIRISVDKKFNILLKPEVNYTMEDILQLLPNRSSVEDFIQMIHRDLLIDQAKELGCGTILFSESMNKLSALVLSSVIKGRGSNLYKDINDVDYEDIHIIHALRELTETELRYYNKVNNLTQFEQTPPELSHINKNLTISQITDRYLRQVEANGYTSTIPTVLKIAEKLVEPTKFDPLGTCKICSQIIYQNPKSWLSKITVNECAPLVDDTERDYFDQYMHSFEQDVEYDVSSLNVCYGCFVSMQGSESIVWPSEKQEIQNTLDEFIIDEDEED